MSITEHDKDWIKLKVKDMIFNINKEIIKEHIKTCPYGRSLLITKSLLVGIVIGAGLLGSGVGVAIAKLLPGLM